MNVQIEYDKEFPLLLCEREKKNTFQKSWAKMNPSTLCTFVNFCNIKQNLNFLKCLQD
jgi:hypothetical protein